MPTMQDLSTMFGNGDFGLLDRGLQANNTEQQTNAATLAGLLQKQQQDAAMHPLDMKYKEASTGNLNAQARNSHALAAQHEDVLEVLKKVPMQARVDDWMSTALKNKSSAQLEALKSHMETAAQVAALALKNGGNLPLGEQAKFSQTHPEILEYLKQPNGAQTLANMVTAYNALGAARQQSDSAHNISASAQRYSADRMADSRAEVAQLYAAAAEQRAALKAAYDNNPIHRISALTTQRMQALFAAENATDPAKKAEYMKQVANLDREIYSQSAAAALQARAFAPVGGIDLNKQTDGKVVTTPVPDLVPKDKGDQPAANTSNTVRTPDGKIHEFPTAEAANKFRKAAGL